MGLTMVYVVRIGVYPGRGLIAYRWSKAAAVQNIPCTEEVRIGGKVHISCTGAAAFWRPKTAAMGEAEATVGAELLGALAPGAAERELLACITDQALHDALLSLLLRAPVGAPVRVEVNDRMLESDAFGSVSLQTLLSDGEYVPALLYRDQSGAEMTFSLKCVTRPQLEKMYDGDAVVDHLLQYFAKDLIRFPIGKVCITSSRSCHLYLQLKHAWQE